MWKQILLGLLIAGMGGVVTYFAQQLADMFGPIPWAEAHLSSTKTMFVLIGFVVVMVGFLILFGVIPVEAPVTSVSSMGIG